MSTQSSEIKESPLSIAPFRAEVFTNPSNPGWSEECINTHLSRPELETLTKPCREMEPPMAAAALVALGLVPLLADLVCLAGWAIHLTGDLFPDPLPVLTLVGIGVTLAGLVWAGWTMSPKRSYAKAWRDSLSAAWLRHSSHVVLLKDVPKNVRDEVEEYAISFDNVGRRLNRLDPHGDELDGARLALARFIQASRIPLLNKRAAEAPHIKDPAVRRAAKDYQQAVAKQQEARRALDAEVVSARELLTARLQERTDAELIRLVNERTLSR